ncbi:MAG: DUF3596 domain-containing protein [Pseudomonadota bacterium]|nr:DUF3596 domain-containing protein [Pseudomonadota bacterium]
MASIRVRPENGKLYFDFHVGGKRCREYSALNDTPANRRKMEAVLKKIESEIALGTFDYARYFPGSRLAARFARPRDVQPSADMALPSATAASFAAATTAPLFHVFVGQWKAEKQVEWRQSYRDAVESMLSAHLIPAFGDHPLNRIDRPMVLAFRTQLSARRVGADPEKKIEGKPIAPATINRIVGILRLIMDEAALRYGLQNPCLSIKRLKNPRKDIEPFSLDEVQAMLGRVRPDYRPYLTLRFFTGMRSGEVHGLKWKHIDFERRQILVRETYLNGRIEYTKTDGSQREIHISEPVLDALMQMRPDGYAKAPKDCDETYVFRTRVGNPIDNTNFNDRVWKPLLRNLGFKYRRPYQMRHTCATLWLASGESAEWIARQLGHTTTEMLFRTYSRFVPNLTRKDGSAFDRLVGEALTRNAAANDPHGITVGRGGAHG